MFGKNIDYDPDSVGDLPQNFKKLTYQVDAVNQGYQMLLQHEYQHNETLLATMQLRQGEPYHPVHRRAINNVLWEQPIAVHRIIFFQPA